MRDDTILKSGFLFAFPGIWRRYKGPVKKDGANVDIETYSFLTTTPNSLVSTINHERMPVLLTREEEFETWLRGSLSEAMSLAREYRAGECCFMYGVRIEWAVIEGCNAPLTGKQEGSDV